MGENRRPTSRTDRPVAKQRPRPSSRSVGVGLERDRAMWEDAMRKLRIGTWALSIVLLAIIARAVLDGLTTAAELTGALVALILLAVLLLRRRGRGLEPARSVSPTARTSEDRRRRQA